MLEKRSNRRQLLQKGGVLGVFAALLGPTNAFAASAKDSVGLEGSWLTTVTISASDAPPPFLALTTFLKDGGYIETDQSQLMPPFLGSPGHGTWVSTGERQFALTFLSLSFDAKGTHRGMSKVRQVVFLEENGDAYSGSGEFEVLDVHAKPVLSGHFKTQGKRIRVEPF